VAVMTPVDGTTRAVCKECGQEIVATKDGQWVHARGQMMMHIPYPRHE
jgi:hypothetical protein